MSPNSSDSPFVMRALENLFDSLSPEAKQSFLARSRASSSPASEPMGIQHLTVMQADGDNEDNTPSPTQTGTTIGPAAKRRQVLNDRKKKKPLNAFIAYRSYYSPIFAGLTQKAKSGIVQQLWAEEPRKPFFALLGQAYSELRDSNVAAGLDKDFLKKFMPVVVAVLPIIPADDYLDTMGWTRRVDHDGVAILERSGTVVSIPDESLRTNASAADIIDYCYKIGVVTRPSSATTSPARNAGGAMSFAAAPTMSSTLRRQLWPSAANPAIDGQAVAPVSATEATPAPSMLAPEFDFSDLRSAPTIEQVTADQQQAFEQLPMPIHFHPGIQPPVLGFDPNMIQDDFDPYNFDVDQYLNLDFKV